MSLFVFYAVKCVGCPGFQRIIFLLCYFRSYFLNRCGNIDNNLINSTLIENLPPNTNTTITFHWGTTSVTPCNHYNITAKATILLGETNTTNNILTDGTVKIKMIGDADGDGRVDMNDIYLVAKGFGSYPGHPKWNPAADINKDGNVGIMDIAMISGNFGKTYP